MIFLCTLNIFTEGTLFAYELYIFEAELWAGNCEDVVESNRLEIQQVPSLTGSVLHLQHIM